MGHRIISMNVFWRWYDTLRAFLLSVTGKSHLDENILELHSFFPHEYSSNFLGFDSGRSALLFILQTFSKIRPNADEVVLPLYVCNGVLDPILQAGLKPVFCDIGDDLNINTLSCLESVCDKTLAVIVPHTYGYPADIGAIYEKVKEKYEDVFVIDDAASGMGNVNGSDILGFGGDVGLFSLNQAKAFPATGGGLLTVNCDHLLPIFSERYRCIQNLSFISGLMRHLRFFLMYKAPYYSNIFGYYISKFFSGKNLSCFCNNSSVYKLPVFDMNLLLIGRKSSKSAHEKRKEIYQHYVDRLGFLEGIEIPQDLIKDNFFSRFAIYISGLSKLKTTQDTVVLWKKKGIHFQYGYRCFNSVDIDSDRFRKSLDYIDNLLILPIDHTRSVDSHLVVIEAIKEINSLSKKPYNFNETSYG